MKKLFLHVKALAVFFMLTHYSTAQGVVEELINPAKSRGYIAWNSIDNADYSVNIYEKTDSVTYSLISKTDIIERFYKLDNLLFFTPNMFYKVVAYSTTNNSIVASTDYIPCKPVENPFINAQNGTITWDPLCEKVCNGESYAWKLTALEKYNNGVTTGSVMLEPSIAYISYDEELNYAPYWQPMSATVYSNLPGNHPYKATINGTGTGEIEKLYRTIDIPNNASYNYLDASGTHVGAGGLLIEKKMDQYDIFVSPALDINAGAGICSSPFLGTGSTWVGSYNSGYQYTNPQSYNWTSVPVTQLGCVEAPSNSGGSGTSGSGTNPRTHYLEFLEKLRDFEDENPDGGMGIRLTLPSTWREMATKFSTLTEVVSLDGDSLEIMTINSVLDSSINLKYTKNSYGRLELLKTKGALTPGVYTMHLYTQNGNVYPVYYEFNRVLPVAKQKDFVSMSINPNPVINDNLNVTFNSVQNVSGQVMIFDLNGTILYTESISLNENQVLNKQYLVDGTYPYNQLRVSFILNDGSVIQKTVLVQ